MYVLKKSSEFLFSVWTIRDKRLSHLPLMDSPLPYAILFVVYFYATKIGPKLMEPRKPLNIKRIIIIYNIIQIFLNGLFSIKLWQYAFTDKFSFACQPVVWGNSTDAIFLAYCSYWYFLLKLLDYVDTVFFILRKKNEHISFLHVYHHSIVSLGVYVQALFSPAGQMFIIGAINTFIHTVMYSYYLITILKPEVRANDRIKKGITTMQMIQFGVIILHSSYGLYTQCNYPLVISVFVIVQNVFMVCLFGDFYYKSYLKVRKSTMKNGNKIR